MILKKSFLLFILLFISHHSLFSSEFELSPRVGVEIDKQERDFFGLFPKINIYLKCRITQSPDSNYTAIITFSRQNREQDTTIKLTKENINALREFVENFENIYNASNPGNYKLDLKKIREFQSPSTYYQKTYTELEITLMDNSMIKGQLLYADKDYLMVWIGDEDYDWRKSKDRCKVISYSEIRKISNVDYNYIGGNFDIYIADLQELKEYISFIPLNSDEVIFPEANNLIYEYLKVKHATYAPVPMEEIIKSSTKNFYIQAGFTISTFLNSKAILKTTRSTQITSYSMEHFTIMPINVIVGYQIDKDWGIEAIYEYFPKSIINGMEYGVNVNYTILDFMKYSFMDFSSKIKLSAGIHSHSLTLDNDWEFLLDYSWYDDYLDALGDKSGSKYRNDFLVGKYLSLNLGASFGMYIFKNISLNYKLALDYRPELSDAVSSWQRYGRKTLISPDNNFFSHINIGFSFNIGYHF